MKKGKGFLNIEVKLWNPLPRHFCYSWKLLFQKITFPGYFPLPSIPVVLIILDCLYFNLKSVQSIIMPRCYGDTYLTSVPKRACDHNLQGLLHFGQSI